MGSSIPVAMSSAWKQVDASNLFPEVLAAARASDAEGGGKNIAARLANLYRERSQQAERFDSQALAQALHQLIPTVPESDTTQLLWVLSSLVLQPKPTVIVSSRDQDHLPGRTHAPRPRDSQEHEPGHGPSKQPKWSNSQDKDDVSHSGASCSSTTSSNPLLGLSSMQIATQLAKQLNEPVAKTFLTFASKLGAEGCWSVCLDTLRVLQAAQEGRVDVKDANVAYVQGSEQKQRTPGGLFLHLARMAAAARKGTAGTPVAEAQRELRQYQRDCLNCIWEKKGNWVIVAPTGSGKTELVVQYTQRLLETKPKAKVVVLVPTVLLTRQHTTYFESSLIRAAFPNFTADHFSGEKPLSMVNWKIELEVLTVMVVVADVFNNLVHKGGYDVLKSIDLLVLDECHHVTGDHPYAKIMDKYVALKETQAVGVHLPVVLGITASPAGNVSLEGLKNDMMNLMRRVDCTNLYHINEEADSSLTQCLPSPMERRLMSGKRSIDGEMRSLLGAALVDGASMLGESLASDSIPSAPSKTQKKLLELVGALAEAVQAGGESDSMRHWIARAQNLSKAISKRMQVSTECSATTSSNARGQLTSQPLHNFVLVTKLLKAGSKAVDMATYLGYECALQFMGRKVASLSSRARQSVLALDLNSHLDPNWNPADERRPTRWWDGSAAQSKDAAQLTARDEEEAQGVGILVGMRDLTAQLAARTGRTAAAIAVNQMESGRWGGLEMDNIKLSVCLLSKQYINNVVPPLDAAFIHTCFSNHHNPSGVLEPPPHSFPKIWDLVQYLMRYRDRDSFHGIVFATTRHGVFHIAEVLRACHKQLSFIQSVHELTGHSGKLLEGGAPNQGSGAKSKDMGEDQVKGMTGAVQESVLAAFRADGRRVLIATSAAEEGLDIPSCEFVVRYNAAHTGIQRVQSRGRARALRDAEFVIIMQEGTLDTHHNDKSTLEEDNMNYHLKSQHPRQAPQGHPRPDPRQ